MSQSRAPQIITIRKQRAHGAVPAYISLAHRHFEKELPEGKKEGEGRVYIMSIEFLSMVLLPELCTDVVAVEVGYVKRR